MTTNLGGQEPAIGRCQERLQGVDAEDLAGAARHAAEALAEDLVQLFAATGY